ncbi:MAG: carbon-nitrogen hydrolase family protein [Candidatus Thorarchaeota archaeon]|nr:MAG: carbon-nitrogen hydrolase family protein [Candidatus Thorarchaeota archaeon]
MRRLRVGLLKAMPRKWDKDANYGTMERVVRRASEYSVDLVVTPECFLDGYVVEESDYTRKRLMGIAEEGENGIYIRKTSQLAGELRILLIVGFTEKQNGKLFNSAYLFGKDGTILGKYRKVHTNFPPNEPKYLSGDSLPVFDIGIGKCGILICADRRWPENARVLRLQGAEVIFVPSFGMWHGQNTMWMRTRSYENGVHICFAHPQLSLITDPEGDICAELRSNAQEFLFHDIDLDLTSRAHIETRRSELYHALSGNIQQHASAKHHAHKTSPRVHRLQRSIDKRS